MSSTIKHPYLSLRAAIEYATLTNQRLFLRAFPKVSPDEEVLLEFFTDYNSVLRLSISNPHQDYNHVLEKLAVSHAGDSLGPLCEFLEAYYTINLEDSYTERSGTKHSFESIRSIFDYMSLKDKKMVFRVHQGEKDLTVSMRMTPDGNLLTRWGGGKDSSKKEETEDFAMFLEFLEFFSEIDLRVDLSSVESLDPED